MWKRIFLPLLFASSFFVTGCDLVEQIGEGNLLLDQIKTALGIQPADRTVASETKSPIHSGLPPRLKPMAAQNKTGWGSCDDSNAQEALKVFRRAYAELKEVWVATASGERIEKLKVNPVTIDLFRLASETSAILSEAAIPAGEYKEIQLMLRDATLVDTVGKSWPLEIPNGEKNGVRIQLERTLVIQEHADKPKISLTFCTDSNFAFEAADKPNRRLEFHPIIDRVANLTF